MIIDAKYANARPFDFLNAAALADRFGNSVVAEADANPGTLVCQKTGNTMMIIIGVKKLPKGSNPYALYYLTDEGKDYYLANQD